VKNAVGQVEYSFLGEEILTGIGGCPTCRFYTWVF
jgi:hypothetical protein